MSATPHTDRLAELEASNPALAAIYEQTWRPALHREARLQREAEATAATAEQATVVRMVIDRGGKLGQLASMRSRGLHLMADMFEANNAHDLRVEREALAAESDPPGGEAA